MTSVGSTYCETVVHPRKVVFPHGGRQPWLLLQPHYTTFFRDNCEPPEEAWQSSLSSGGISGLLRCARNDKGFAQVLLIIKSRFHEKSMRIFAPANVGKGITPPLPPRHPSESTPQTPADRAIKGGFSRVLESYIRGAPVASMTMPPIERSRASPAQVSHIMVRPGRG